MCISQSNVPYGLEKFSFTDDSLKRLLNWYQTEKKPLKSLLKKKMFISSLILQREITELYEIESWIIKNVLLY